MPRNADLIKRLLIKLIWYYTYLVIVLEQMNCISHVYANRRCSDVQLREQQPFLFAD